MWVLFAILAAVFAALTSIFVKVGIENVDPNLATAIRTVVVVGMAWGIVFLTGVQTGIGSISTKTVYSEDRYRGGADNGRNFGYGVIKNLLRRIGHTLYPTREGYLRYVKNIE